ncbi:uncharacterized protein LOC6037226 isoform X2 [Culex quinquefasciatus]|uniref:uncharacterized protein LOC6037226 isoform X2 n=1 Tax=Culex quinquefasciatus TaxID=7176 RepID=UPI0018E323F6|nr:uncharacterized protein LOC6037226 isoform X2 [Culex quinquefasciatus]
MMGRNAAGGPITSCPKTPALVNNFRRMPMSILETPALIKRPPGDQIKTAVVGPSPAATRPFWMFSEGPKAKPGVQFGSVRGTTSGWNISAADSSSFVGGERKENVARNVEERPAKRVCFEPLPLQPQQSKPKWVPKVVPAQTVGQSKGEAPKQKSKPDPKKLRIITGSVEHILKLSRSAPEEAPLVELFANILSIRKGAHDCERVLLLRNKSGPVLQGVFFEIDFRMPVVGAGDCVRCVGRLTGGSRLQILKITPASDEDELMGLRLQKVSGFAAECKR